ncbi:MAG: quinone-dependent dihydroorotate dehydrogenase [Spirosomataceae bacterium]
MYKYLLRPLFFRMDAEKAHHRVTSLLLFLFNLPFVKSIFRRLYTYEHPALEVNVAGLKFKNPIGLAAGFDKNAELVDIMDALGFGFVEIGTVTPRPQPGNPKPRLFRLREDKALINRMGFNNRGAGVAAGRLRSRKSSIIVGGNIGKNKDTPNHRAEDDYIECFKELYDFVDYFVVNVSSPNTPGLRELQEKEPLKELLTSIQKRNLEKPISRPIFLKIAPDLTTEQLDDIIEIVRETKITGVIATNTTISRENLKTTGSVIDETGGLSGYPLEKRATEVVRYICEKSQNAFPVIGVGGIHSVESAKAKLDAGASLLQIYTGFIYEGPALASKLCRGLVRNKIG